MPPQTYDTHRHQPRVWAITWLLAVIALLSLIVDAVRHFSLQTLALALLGVVVLLVVTLLRVFALRLQDRIIRLEMQVRFARLGLSEAAAALSLQQMIATRFASDAELPALIERAAAEKMTPDQIKRAVRDWQPDVLRT